MRRLLGWSLMFLLVVAWEIASRAEIIDATLTPAPSAIGRAWWRWASSGGLWYEASATLQRIAWGYAIGATWGMLLATACAAHRMVEHAVSPLVEFTRAIAPLALFPVFLLVLGIGESARIGIVAWVVWAPVYLSALSGLDEIDRSVIEAAQLDGASRWECVWWILLPLALPSIVSGLRLGIGSALLVIVAAEMLGAHAGLGYYIIDASQTFKVPDMYAAILTVGVLGIIVNAGVQATFRRWLPGPLRW